MDLMKRLFALLRSQLGQVPGAAEVVESADDGQGGEPASSEPSTEGAAPSTPAEPLTEESFVDPATLPPELKAHWKRMHGSFTKRMQELAGERTKIDAYNRLMMDGEYAKQVILEAAPRLGLKVSKDGDSPQPGTEGNGAGHAPPELVKAVESRLPQELKWMAQAQADAFYEANKLMLEPLKRQQEQQLQSQREAEYETMAEELSSKIPGWEEHEDTMFELLQFMAGSQMRHPRFGSKLEILHSIINGGAAATQEATRRMVAAVKNKTTTGKTGSPTVTNIAERIKAAKTDQEKWQIAADAALKQHGR